MEPVIFVLVLGREIGDLRNGYGRCNILSLRLGASFRPTHLAKSLPAKGIRYERGHVGNVRANGAGSENELEGIS